MSHIATNWAFTQRGLKPASKLVLLVLADCHNPAHGCFPSQAFMASECEMSRTTVNVHLDTLENLGLIRRIPTIDPITRRQRSTRYKLAFEPDFDRKDGEGGCSAEAGKTVSGNQTRESKAVSGFPSEPCPDFVESRVRIPDTNPVREPLREPVSAPLAENAVEALPEGFERFWQAFPRKRDRSRCVALFDGAMRQGVTAERIAQAAERYRAESVGLKPMYQACSDNWLERRRWEDYPMVAAPKARTEAVRDLAVFWAGKVKAGRYVPASAITQEVAACMVGNGLVAESDLLRAGVRV